MANTNLFTEPVYFISSPEDETVLIGMEVTLRGDYLEWFDTTRERIMRVSDIKESSIGYVVKVPIDNEVRTYTFTPLTLELYNLHVRDKLLAGKDFTDIESLHTAIEATKTEAW